MISEVRFLREVDESTVLLPYFSEPTTKVVPIDASPAFETATISIDVLYRDNTALRPELSTALRLLAEATEFLDSALAAVKDDDLFSADDCVQGVQAILPELFSAGYWVMDLARP